MTGGRNVDPYEETSDHTFSIRCYGLHTWTTATG
jgi:hypothetical protein